jgi:diacylglycerol kinase (ATP)
MSGRLAESDPMHNPHKGHTGLTRILLATRHSCDGLVSALRHESAFRQELALALLLLPAALWLGRTWVERALLIGSVLAVLIVELLNSGIEAAIDRMSLDLHELSKRAKDYGSAAVMLALLACGAVWVMALWARLQP